MKPIRKAVRTFLIQEDNVVAIKYIKGNCKDYYDIPGGKIEGNETKEEAAIREFKEETGIDIFNPEYAGNLIIEYSDRVYDIDVFITSEYNGEIVKKDETITEWINIDKLLQEKNRFAIVSLLDEWHEYSLLNKVGFKWHFIADNNHNLVDQIFYSKDEPFWSEWLD